MGLVIIGLLRVIFTLYFASIVITALSVISKAVFSKNVKFKHVIKTILMSFLMPLAVFSKQGRKKLDKHLNNL